MAWRRWVRLMSAFRFGAYDDDFDSAAARAPNGRYRGADGRASEGVMRRNTTLDAFIAAVMLAGCARSVPPRTPAARGSEPVPLWTTAAPATAPNALAIVVSGGVSLGAYQGGYLYALSEELKRRHVKPPLYVGASAGTINALLLGIEMCHASQPDPTQSALRWVWMQASLARLRAGTQMTSPTAIFPQDGVRKIAQIVEPLLTSGLDPDCDFVVAGETSRIHPRSVRVADDETVPNIQEPFTIRVKTGPNGLQIHNYVVNDGTAAEQALLPFPQEQSDAASRSKAIDLLIDFALASSAFPAAFPQVYLPYCLNGADETTNDSNLKDPKSDCGDRRIYKKTAFADGGILDNTPVDLAIQVARSGYKERKWDDAPRTPSPKDRPSGVSYLLVDMDSDAYDALPARPQTSSSFLPFAETFATGFLNAARGRALYDTLDQYPELRDRLVISTLHPPLAGRYLGDFFGFFDARLRDFDFTGGMYDAAALVASGWLEALLKGVPMADPQAADVAGASKLSSLEASTLPWRKLACLAQALGPRRADGQYDRCAPLGDAEPSPPWQSIDAYDGPQDFESFVELTQASLDELYSQCLCAKKLSERPLRAACEALLTNSKPPHLRKNFDSDADDWQLVCTEGPDGSRSSETIEDPLEYELRRLARYGFAESSLSASQAMVRDRIGALADDLAGRQPCLERIAAKWLGPVVLDASFGYRPALHSAHIVSGYGGTEVGYSVGRRLRAMVAAQLKTSRDEDVAVTPLVGVDWNMPSPWPLVQGNAFARGGFQFGSTGPKDVSPACSGGFGGHADRCVIGEAGFAVTFLDVLRVQGIWEESSAPFGSALDHLLVEGGFQANWPMGSK
jgi:hypothetical protein